MRHPFSDIRALALITLGALLFLALYTFTPDDVPARFSMSSRAVPNDPVLNAIGPFGAVIGGYTIFLFGPAAFLVPACLIWLGMSRVLMPARRMGRPSLGFGLVVVSASVVLGLQTSFFQTWWSEYNILGPGGAIGFHGPPDRAQNHRCARRHHLRDGRLWRGIHLHDRAGTAHPRRGRAPGLE